MKMLLKVLGIILVSLVVALVVLRFTGLNPHERVPGLWLSGDLVTTPVTDWSFADQHETLKVQTHTWYLIPHSVTTNCISYNGQLYLTSTYAPGLVFPNARSWNRDVVRDPHVRLKIGDRLYDRTLSYVTDPAEKAAVLATKEKKYPSMKIRAGSTVNLFHVMDN